MSISPISSASSYQANQVNWQNNSAQSQSAFQALASALQTGNLRSAQQAFAVLQQLQPNLSTGIGNVQNPFAADYDALGSALKANNLQGAKDAFAKLLQDMQSVKGYHRHHHKASASTQNTASTTYSPIVGLTSGRSGNNQNASGSSSFGVYV